jgi:hypothetical protein
MCHKTDMKQVLYWGPTNIRCHHIKFSCQGNPESRISAPLIHPKLTFHLQMQRMIAAVYSKMLVLICSLHMCGLQFIANVKMASNEQHIQWQLVWLWFFVWSVDHHVWSMPHRHGWQKWLWLLMQTVQTCWQTHSKNWPHNKLLCTYKGATME